MSPRPSPACAARAHARVFALLLLLAPTLAWALPQFAVRGAGRCEPAEGADAAPDPSCARTCAGCHVAPTGGGPRTAAGQHYQRTDLSSFRLMPPEATYPGGEIARIWSRPDLAPGAPDAAGSGARLAGVNAHPDLQVGADIRFGLRAPLADAPEPPDAVTGASSAQALSPQTDLYLLARPYNPRGQGGGRLTLAATFGMTPAAGEAVWEGAERFQVREWWALYDDLPYHLAVRIGRFEPAFGWRFGDDAAFTRGASFPIFGRPLDRNRQVTGVELSLNPGPFYAHLGAFLAADAADDPFNADHGGGGNLAVGWRGRVAQVGLSALMGRRDGVDLAAFGLNWGFDLQALLPKLPLVYLGEVGLNRRAPRGPLSAAPATEEAGAEAADSVGSGALGGLEDEPRLSLAAHHELDWFFAQGLYARLAYTWRDADTEFAYDTRHRAVAGLQWYPIEFLGISGEWRHDWRSTDDRFALEGDALHFEAHFIY